MALSREMQARVDRVRERAPIDAVVRKAMKLGAGSKPRGKCPFHGSRSDSFSVDPDSGRARCWGCGWSGDVLRFVQDHYGLAFRDALERLESENGLDGVAAAPVHREKEARPARARAERPRVSSAVMGRWLWDHAGRELSPVRRYLAARGVPGHMLAGARLRDVRFIAQGPIYAWAEGEDPRGLPSAPAMLALIRRAPRPILPGDDEGGGEADAEAEAAGPWEPIGVHATFLNPAFDGKMVRPRADGSLYPDRKMLGEAGGGALVMPGTMALSAGAPIYEGEGIETTLSGMALTDAPAEACGLAVLSLGNMQFGDRPKLIGGAIPLYDPEPDLTRPGVAFAHAGPVTLLVDADMKPLRGPIDRRTGQPRGERIIEVRRGPIVHRALTGAERSAMCATMAVKAWRAAGCRQVRAVRPPMGQDFNDVARNGISGEGRDA